MRGPEVARALRPLAPRAAVLFMSGYAEEALEGDGLGGAGVRLVSKPFTPDELRAAVRRAIDERQAAPARGEDAG